MTREAPRIRSGSGCVTQWPRRRFSHGLARAMGLSIRQPSNLDVDVSICRLTCLSRSTTTKLHNQTMHNENTPQIPNYTKTKNSKIYAEDDRDKGSRAIQKRSNREVRKGDKTLPSFCTQICRNRQSSSRSISSILCSIVCRWQRDERQSERDTCSDRRTL